MRARWHEIQPAEQVRTGAERLLKVHRLRAGDAFQLAAALVWCNHQPGNRPFISGDDVLTGKETYERAIAALRNWKQFDLGWVKILPDETPLEVGATVVIQAKAFGFWSLSASRIVYLINENAPLKRFGFAYGTLPDHVECGEERFTIEWEAGADSVWYEILAFSRPKNPLVRLGFPLARMLQKRFARESLGVMATLAHANSLRPQERSKQARG